MRLEVALREADRAEANARALRAEAQEAERQSQSSQENVRKTIASIQREQPTYAKPRADSTSAVSPQEQKLVEQMDRATGEGRTQSANVFKANVYAAPAGNTQGQATGRIVNVSA